jgi:hypothetical protein
MSKEKVIEKENVNINLTLTRSIYLKSFAFIYLLAYLSLYFQIQGLWGDEGLLPASNLMEKIKENYKDESTSIFPIILWYSEIFNSALIFVLKFLRLDSFFLIDANSSVENSLYILCLLGIILSILILISCKLVYNSLGFALLWYIYLNFYIIGQTFMTHQWDTLLLESGFITIFICPWTYSKLDIMSPIDNLLFHYLRFLLFRFMFSNGVGKFISNDYSWLSFTALHFHFQSQPMPGPFSHATHFLPNLYKKILNAELLFIEIFLPFLYFSFFRRINVFAGCLNFCLQFVIFLIGNYNFFNLLLMTINLSLLDDYFLRTFIPKFILNLFDLDPFQKIYSSEKAKSTSQSNKEENDESQNIYFTTDKLEENMSFSERLKQSGYILTEIFIFFYLFCISLMIVLFKLFPISDLQQAKLLLKVDDIKFLYNDIFMNYYTVLVFGYILFFYIYDIKKTLCFRNNFSLVLKIVKYVIFISCFFLYFLNASKVFHKSIDLKYIDEKGSLGIKNSLLTKTIDLTSDFFIRYRIHHSYGMFREMTGRHGRQELEIKVLNPRSGIWEDVNFIYKMSDSRGLKYNIPHQPRLDWQMWHSSLAEDINSETWLSILLGKILERSPVILDLLGYHIKLKEGFYQCILL